MLLLYYPMKILNYSDYLELFIIIVQFAAYFNQVIVHSYLYVLPIDVVAVILLLNLFAITAFLKANHYSSDASQFIDNFKKNDDKKLPDNIEYCKLCKRYIVIRDHHCMFLGQCVDKANYIYFLSYVMYSYVLSSLLLTNLLFRVNIVWMAFKYNAHIYFLTGFFGLISGLGFFFFTAGLFASSVRLTIQGVTKVEDLKKKKQKVITPQELMKKVLTPWGLVWLWKQYNKNYEMIFGEKFKLRKLLIPIL